MCGRYALALRPSEVRQRLQESHMPSQEAPDDGDTRQTYNFAPSYYGLVYRADIPDHGSSAHENDAHTEELGNGGQNATEGEKEAAPPAEDKEPRYKIQAMKWGLIPFWTKRQPDYASSMKTINCRDDSLAMNGGMWNTMKQRKRCIVIAQGFYEWLKKNGGKEKVPHFVKRKDGQLMCFAGLWDCVKYEDSSEKLYTYTVITTDSNKQLNFLHDRMPVIFNNGSDELFTWLDSNRSEWSKELQSLLKPFEGELECYPVTKEVGKVGNNSPAFIVPVDSSENKQNIANFFGNQKKIAENAQGRVEAEKEEGRVKKMDEVVQHDPKEERATTEKIGMGEDNAPLPAPTTLSTAGTKRSHESIDDIATEDDEHLDKAQKIHDSSPTKKATPAKASARSKNPLVNTAFTKKSPVKATDGSSKITSFFGK